MKKPNFLVFMTDHQRGDMQPPFGKIHTPNLDRLFKNGVSFTHAYCPAPHCCPARATFFSGLYPSEHGVWDNVNVSNAKSRGLFDGVRLFSEDLKDAGYNMYFSGKWHISDFEGPDKRGFEILHPMREEFTEKKNSPSMWDWNRYKLGWAMADPSKPREEGEIIREGYHKNTMFGVKDDIYKDGDIVNASVKKLEEIPDDEPFFMFVGAAGPHTPYYVGQEFLDMYNPDDIKLPESFGDMMTDKPAMYRRIKSNFSQFTLEEHKKALLHYYAFCTFEDYLFGQLLDALEKRGLLDNTVVIYNSDHGDYAGAHGLWEKGLPCFSEAYHVNSVIGFGGIKQKEKVVDKFVSLADYAPTFLELAGVQANRRFCGSSLAGFLRGENPDNWREEIFTQTNGNENYGIQRAVFDKKYKYVYNGFDYDELYDLENDPNEMTNLINKPEYTPIVRKMWEKIYCFAFENKDDISNGYIIAAMMPYGPGIIC